MVTLDLESELRRGTKAFLDATDDFQRRLATMDPELAVEWGHHMREALMDLERVLAMLAKIYTAPPEAESTVRKEFVQHCLKDFGPSWYRHLQCLKELYDARHPEPPDPEDQ